MMASRFEPLYSIQSLARPHVLARGLECGGSALHSAGIAIALISRYPSRP